MSQWTKRSLQNIHQGLKISLILKAYANHFRKMNAFSSWDNIAIAKKQWLAYLNMLNSLHLNVKQITMKMI